MKKILFAIAFLLTTNLLADTPNKTVTAKDLGDRVLFTVVLNHTAADSVSSIYSQAIQMKGLTPEGGSIQFVGAITEADSARDVDLFLEGSNNLTGSNFASFATRTEWNDFSPDAADTSLIYIPDKIYVDENSLVSALPDSTGLVERTDPAFGCRYIRFRSAGQTGTTSAHQTTVYLTMRKTVPNLIINWETDTVFSTE